MNHIVSIQPQESARLAGLQYVQDSQPGIQRQRWGRGFTFFDTSGERITEKEERDRLKALKIPPAWTGVWICPNPRGHLLATGRDARGRKQYLYHPDWRRIRNQTKFDRMVAFGRALPHLRQTVSEDLARPGLSRIKIIATVIRLLEKTLIRVGNESYVKENQSFGLTTLRDRHLMIRGNQIRFQFTGKSGIDHSIELLNSKLAKILRRCQELPGYELFQYYDDDQKLQSIESDDVNQYLHRVMGDRFSAKDFRTWFGSVRAFEVLMELDRSNLTTTATKSSEDAVNLREERIREAIHQTAELLGNRPATCKKYYIHPKIFETYRLGELIAVQENTEQAILDLLSPSEKTKHYLVDSSAMAG